MLHHDITKHSRNNPRLLLPVLFSLSARLLAVLCVCSSHFRWWSTPTDIHPWQEQGSYIILCAGRSCDLNLINLIILSGARQCQTSPTLSLTDHLYTLRAKLHLYREQVGIYVRTRWLRNVYKVKLIKRTVDLGRVRRVVHHTITCNGILPIIWWRSITCYDLTDILYLYRKASDGLQLGNWSIVNRYRSLQMFVCKLFEIGNSAHLPRVSTPTWLVGHQMTMRPA